MASHTCQGRNERGDQRCETSISKTNSIPGRRSSAANGCPAQSQVALRGQRQAKAQGQRQAPPARPIYQRRDTWYEFLLKQFNPSNFDYGGWIEERRQVFLDASVRNPYFKYSLGTTIALLVMAMLYTKQWIDHRRAMWITAEMMTDLYNHDPVSYTHL